MPNPATTMEEEDSSSHHSEHTHTEELDWNDFEDNDTSPLDEKRSAELNQNPPRVIAMKVVKKPMWYTDKKGVFRKRRKPNWKVASRKAMKQFLRRGNFVLPPPKKTTDLQK